MLNKSFILLLLILKVFGFQTYTVKPGDNYYKIGRQFHVDYRELAKLNKKKLRAGQKIKIPGYILYKVKLGDNFSSISTKFKVKILKIKEYNKINQLYIGNQIKIPISKDDAVLLDDLVEKKNPVRKKNSEFLNKEITTAKKNNKLKKNVIKKKSEKISFKKKQKKNYHQDFVWPVNGKVISSFGMDKTIMNYGLLIKTSNRKVISSETGVVFFVGKIRGLGTTMLILHQDNYLTIYTGLKNVFCKKGDFVKKGKKIADLKKNEIFFSIFNNGDPENPLSFLKSS